MHEWINWKEIILKSRLFIPKLSILFKLWPFIRKVAVVLQEWPRLKGWHMLCRRLNAISELFSQTLTNVRSISPYRLQKFDLFQYTGYIQGGPDSIRQFLIINNQSIQQHTAKWESTFCCEGSCHLPVCCWIDWLLMIKNCLIESDPPCIYKGFKRNQHSVYNIILIYNLCI
jgi:hypothetical protein